MFDLAELETIASLETDETVTLSPMSVAVLLSALTGVLSERSQWQYAGAPLTDSQWDEVEASVADTITALMWS